MTSTKSCILITKMSVKQRCYLLLSFTQGGAKVTSHSLFNILSRVQRLSPQHAIRCLRLLITNGLIIPERYLNSHLNLNFIHHYDVFLAQQLKLAEHSPSFRAFFGSISNTLSVTHLYQMDERPFLGPFRTTHLSASFPVIKAISCIAPSTILSPSPPRFKKFKSLPPHNEHWTHPFRYPKLQNTYF